MIDKSSNKWFLFPKLNPAATLRLFCFPFIMRAGARRLFMIGLGVCRRAWRWERFNCRVAATDSASLISDAWRRSAAS